MFFAITSLYKSLIQVKHRLGLRSTFFTTMLMLVCFTNYAFSSPLTPDEAVRHSLAPNTGLAAMQARAEAMAQVTPQQGALPDPRLHINVVNLPTDGFDLATEPMTQTQLGFSQALPFPGKLALREQVAASNADVARYETDEYRLTLVRDVRHAWWQLFFLDKSLETIATNRKLLQQLVSTTQTKYSVGKGLQQDVLLAQLELSRLTDKELELTAMRKSTEARLNALMDRPSVEPIVLAVVDTDKIPRLKGIQQLQELSHTSRPLLQVGQARIEAAENQLRYAKLDVLPDFTLGANYGFRSGRTDMTSLQLSMSLPLYAGKKQHRNTDQRQADLLANKFALSDSLRKVDADIQMQYARHQQAMQQISLFQQDIIPQAQQTVDSMMAAFQVNKVDFVAVIRAQTTLYNYEKEYWSAFSRAQQTMASLVAAVGQENIYE